MSSGACYQVVLFPLDFDAAREFCLSLEATLITFEASAESNYILSGIQGSQYFSDLFNIGNLLVGLYRPTPTAHFTSVDGGIVVIDNWAPGHPHGSTELCAELQQDGSYAATSCSSPHPFACKTYDCRNTQHYNICNDCEFVFFKL